MLLLLAQQKKANKRCCLVVSAAQWQNSCLITPRFRAQITLLLLTQGEKVINIVVVQCQSNCQIIFREEGLNHISNTPRENLVKILFIFGLSSFCQILKTFQLTLDLKVTKTIPTVIFSDAVKMHNFLSFFSILFSINAYYV